MTFWRVAEDGVSVSVKVQPKSRRSGVQVRAPADAGRANRAACAVLAGTLDVPAGAVSVLAGTTSRKKVLRVVGDAAAIVARLAAL